MNTRLRTCHDQHRPLRRIRRRRGRALTLMELLVVLIVLAALVGMVVPLLSGSLTWTQERTTHATLEAVKSAILGSPDRPGYWTDMSTADLDDQTIIRRLPHPREAGINAGRENHPQLRYLYINPENETTSQTFDPHTRLGWRGPYLQCANAGQFREPPAEGFSSEYGLEGDPAPLDGWGNPIIIQSPTLAAASDDPEKRLRYTRLISAGPSGVLHTRRDWLTAQNIAQNIEQNSGANYDDEVLFLWGGE